ncbi:MAG: hypothetical protein RLZZ417_1442 [Bacteroidota bacterium]|jgi:hypothetical protein
MSMILIIYWKKLKIKWLFTLFFLLNLSFIYAQDTLLISPVSENKKIKIDSADFLDSSKIKLPPNPKKSALLSLILPGAGQIYNGRWWKTPFVYAAIGGSIAYLQMNQSRYNRFKTALELELAKKPHEFTGKINSAEALRNLRNKYDKNTQTSYIGVVVVYGIVAVEAFVDAHLQNFDISDDLSIKLKVPGIQFSYTFQN